MLVSCARRVNDSRPARSTPNLVQSGGLIPTPTFDASTDIARLVEAAFGADIDVERATDVAEGRGTFSEVFRLELARSGTGEAARDGAAGPSAVVAKVPTRGPNRRAASASGAYLREADAYRYLLPRSPIRSPEVFAVLVDGSRAAFLLEDLTPLRRVDQLDGLTSDDAVAVAEALARFHRFWTSELDQPGPDPDRLNLRRSAVSTIAQPALIEGLDTVRRRWPQVEPEQVDGFAQLVAEAPELIAMFGAAGESSGRGQATLCHGDPRADNLYFAADNTPVLFDWQQIAVQFPEADLAWLAATSLDPETRRRCDHRLVSSTEGNLDRYRLGFVLPGMAALLLAQRTADDPRTERFIVASLQRIGTALIDYDVAAIAR